MDLPPDPYLALGVPRDATPAAIKTAHRKLVLKFHPDKVTDPTAKEAAADQFHKAQTAYEILIDEDRRGRYDAQVRLANLRKEAMERKGSGSIRGDARSSSAPYRPSAEPTMRPGYTSRSSERMAPQYEERRPSYAADYFDSKPKSGVRKEPEYERTSRRSGGESKEKPRASTRDAKPKESERERRKEKSRKTEKETKREREQKYSTYVEDDESDSDEHARRDRRMREEDAQRRARNYYSKHRPEARDARDASDAYYDERARKMATHTADARDYIQSRSRPRTEQDRRPSPSRMPSSKDNIEYVKRSDGRPVPVMVRRSSARPKATSRDSDFPPVPSSREPGRRRSDESMADLPRRPPTLTQHKSSPADIRIPESKQRSQSVQVETEGGPRVPQMKRSETAPYPATRRPENVSPTKGSAHRPTVVTEGMPTPALTPENVTPPPGSKYNYGRQYADDAEYPTPDGYRTEVREPVSSKATRPRLTRSPSPIKDIRDARDTRDIRDREFHRDLLREREKPSRAASARYPPSPQQPPHPRVRPATSTPVPVRVSRRPMSATVDPASLEVTPPDWTSLANQDICMGRFPPPSRRG